MTKPFWITDLTKTLSDSADDTRASLAPGQCWHVVHTLPRQEDIARKNLESQGFRVFLPSIGKTVRHARHFRQIQAPAFPRYLFVAFDRECQPWRRINGTQGVVSLIMCGERPTPVRPGVVETLLASSTPSGLLQFSRALAPGQMVRLTAGPFAQSLGVIEALDSAGRVAVLLQILGGVRVTLAQEWIQPAA